MIYIHSVHLIGGHGHEHIASVKWKNPDTNKAATSSRDEIITWIEGGGSAYVCGGNAHMARVEVVRSRPPYIRTVADDTWTDNLLALSRF